MKIMLLHKELSWEGGGDRQSVMLATNLLKWGHQVTIYTTQYNSQSCFPDITKNLDIRPIGTYGNSKDAKKMANIICNIMYEKKESFDIINCHVHPMQWTASYISKMKKIPVVWMCNDLPAWYLPFVGIKEVNWIKWILYKTIIPLIDKLLIKRISAIVVFNRHDQQLIENYYNKKAWIIHSGLDMEKFCDGNREAIRKLHNIEPDTILLLCVSLLGPRRRTQDVIISLKLLISKNYNVKLIVVGGEQHYPGYSEVIRQCAKENGVLEKVILTGSVPEKQLPSYYAASDIFIYPHINQTWGLAPFEAMAARKPTIVSTDTGAADVLINYQTALLVKPKDPELLAKKVVELIENNDLRERLIKQGYDFVKKNISWKKYTGEMLKVFKEVANL